MTNKAGDVFLPLVLVIKANGKAKRGGALTPTENIYIQILISCWPQRQLSPSQRCRFRCLTHFSDDRRAADSVDIKAVEI